MSSDIAYRTAAKRCPNWANGMFVRLAGILGENLVLPDTITKNLAGFLLVNFTTLSICFLVFAGILLYIRYRRLM